MEAKDTVMDDRLRVQAITDNPNVPMGQALIEKQAKISFKAGYKEAFKSQLYNEGYKAGIREVVEWMVANWMMASWKQDKWQAKLKEWEIK